MQSEQFTDQTAKPTFSLQSLLPQEVKKPKKLARNQGPRQQLVNKVCTELGIERHFWSGIFWSAHEIVTDDELVALKDKALKWNTVPIEARARWFRTLLKEKRTEIKEKLKHEK
jgi:hypothetical protein